MATFNSWDEALRTVAWIVEPNLFGTNTQTIQPFSTLDNLNMQSQAWSNTDPNISKTYTDLASGLWKYTDVANQIWGFYDATANAIANRENAYSQAQYNLANQLNQDLANQRDYIYSVFGPQGSLTTEINKYYDDMWNYLASEGWRQMANVAAQWVHSWASLGLLRAQQNEAYNQAFANYLKVKEQEINAKQQIQAQLIDYMTKLRQEYGNTTNQYILSQYQRANDLFNSLNSDLQNQLTNLAIARVQNAWSGTATSNNDTLNTLMSMLAWNNNNLGASAWNELTSINSSNGEQGNNWVWTSWATSINTSGGANASQGWVQDKDLSRYSWFSRFTQ